MRYLLLIALVCGLAACSSRSSYCPEGTTLVGVGSQDGGWYDTYTCQPIESSSPTTTPAPSRIPTLPGWPPTMSPNATYQPSTLEALQSAYATAFVRILEEGTPGPGSDADAAAAVANVVQTVCDDPERFGFGRSETDPVCGR